MPDHGTSSRTARSRALHTILRGLREDAGMRLSDVSDRLDGAVRLSAATLNRIELGKRAATVDEVAAILLALGVTGDRADHVLDLARRATETHWWEASAKGLTPMMRAWIDFEDRATKIRDWSIIAVPGLLQTPDYARAMMLPWTSDEADLQHRVEARISRQRVLTRPGLDYSAVIDEGALRRPLGGNRVMRLQLLQLVQMMDRIKIQVLPMSEHAHAGLAGSFVALSFPDEPDLVQIEHVGSAVILDDDEQVSTHTDALRSLAAMAMSPTDSVRFIEQIAASYS